MLFTRTLGCLGIAGASMGAGINGGQAQRPNIIIILADDLGYSDIGCYGGEIETPNLDRLAENGLRYRQFYNNARSCPSRAALLTGLYPHQAGMGWMAAADLQRPEYQGYINRNCVTFGEVLQTAGYKTCMSGKWHLSSDRQNEGNVMDNWPNQRGFDHFYGVVGGAANYFKAVVNNDNEKIPSSEDGTFYFTHAITDKAAGFIGGHDFGKDPLLLYVAYTAPHWPLHALQEDIDKYTERYKAGWDRLRQERFARQIEIGLFDENTILPPRDEQVPAWDSLSPEEQHEFVMRMAIYAAQVDAMDQGIGKIIAALAEKGELENTVVMFMSDNGACAEHISSGGSKAVNGTEETFESYRRNWANVSSTPYREYKHYTNEGGIASPLIVHYPSAIPENLNGSFVDEYGHFTDIMATCVELSGAKYPASVGGYDIVPMQGVSLVPNFSGGRTPRTVTFWEHEGNIAMRMGKWKIVTKTHEGEVFDPSKVELYDMDADPTEMNDLAATDPARAARMYGEWSRWAEAIGVFPIDTRFYGERQQWYRREHINGEFDDNFGGWAVVKRGKGDIEFCIDEVNTISGNKTARIDIKHPGNVPADAHIKWIFPTAKTGNTASVSFLCKADGPANFIVRLEEINNPQGRILEQTVTVSQDITEFKFDDLLLPKQSRYQLVFLFGQSPQSSCWIDKVNLTVH